MPNHQSNNETKLVEEDKAGGIYESEKVETRSNSTGLNENLAGLLCYLGWIITGIIFIIIEKENQFIRFHAIQSIITSVVFIVANIVLAFIPFIGWIISLLLTPVILGLWIFLMYKAYQGKLFKLPIIGDIVEKQLNQMNP